MRNRRAFGDAPRDERGMAVLAALMCTFIVVSLSTVAVTNSFGSLSSFGQNRSSLLSVDAASAGIQAELAALKAAVGQLTPGATIPCNNGTVSLDQSGTHTANIQDAASTESYVLSLGTPSGTPPTLGPRLPTSGSCLQTVPSATPWYLLIQSRGSTSAKSGGTGRVLQTAVEVTNSSQADSNALNLGLLNNTISYSTPDTKATNNGFGSNSATVNSVTVSIPVLDNFVGVTAATSLAEANTNGSSYSCTGDLSNGQSLTGGSSSSPCTTTGTGNGGIWLDLTKLPGLSGLAGILADLRVNFDAVTSWAAVGSGGSTHSGSATLLNCSLSVTLLGGLTVGPLSMGCPTTALTGPTNLLPLITGALQGNILTAALATSVSNLLTPLISITGDYSTWANNVETVDGLHLVLLNAGVATAATADFGVSTAGANVTNNTFTLQGSKQV